ncbi:MAG: DUF4982 domain-containing protein [Prevotella sp.]|nr:DUF4982 domain-containing protein [Prevotella sp.]
MRQLTTIVSLMVFAVAWAANSRQACDLDMGWRFHPGDVAGAAAPGFDDSSWRTVNVPHDFQIEQPWVEPSPDERPDNSDVAANIKSRLSSRGFKEMGIGWYRKALDVPAGWQGRRVVLQFDGIMYTADVYLNGRRIGGTDYGYVGFEIDVTRDLLYGRQNVIAVRADTREPGNSRWYTGGGLFRDVRLLVTDAQLFFTRHPLYVTTRDNRYVSLSAEFTNRTRMKQTQVVFTIADPDGRVVCRQTATRKRNPQTRTVAAVLPEVELPTPQLWDIDTPRRYTVTAQLLRDDGSVADEVSERFGVRTIEFGPQFGFKLNGRKVLLQGYANHHTLGVLGAAAFPRAIEKRLALMKQFGINHVRTSHNPYSRSFIEMCDSMGLLVVDELYDKWTQQHTGGRVPFLNHFAADIEELVCRDRNSPSVVLWSLGNELQQDPNQPFNDFGVTAYRMMRPVVARYDSTRLVTVAMHPRYRNWETDSLPCDLALQTDIQAYNYRYMYFPGDGRRFPWMTFYQSEASISAMGENFFAMDLDRVIGLAYWGVIDYLGESQGWPAKGWAQGVFDLSLQPKPKAYYMRSFFRPDEPLVHIAVIDKKGDQMWNGVQTGNDGMSDHWNRVRGQKLQLVTYTNADEVELLLNGRSLGRKQNDRASAKMRNQIRWDNVRYKKGTLVAIARNGGREVARHTLQTTGPVSRLVATPDLAEGQWKADGQDLMHIHVQAVDGKGRQVPTGGKLTFSVSGPATIQGVVNGDITSNEMTVGTERSLYMGSADVILRSEQDRPGQVVLTVSDESGRSATVTMTTNGTSA